MVSLLTPTLICESAFVALPFERLCFTLCGIRALVHLGMPIGDTTIL
jgi:hypothetical protein